MSNQQDRRAGLLGSTILSGGFSALAFYLWPGPTGQWDLQAIAFFAAALSVMTGVRAITLFNEWLNEIFRFWRSINQNTTRGSAAWLSEKEARKAKLHKRVKGSRFGGVLGKTVLWLETETHQLILGPAGSAKSTSAILPMLCSTSESCLVSDTKGELYVQTAEMRRKKFSHRIVKLDPTDPLTEKINPLDIIFKHLEAESPKALTLARGMALQLYPEPPQEGANRFFRDGTRILMTCLILAVCVVCENEQRTLANVYRAITDEFFLDELLREAGKSETLGGEIALMADAQHNAAFGDEGDNRTFVQFKTGAIQALDAFGPGNYLRSITSKTTFSFKSLKREKVSAYLIVDFANKDVLGRWSGLMQWLAAQEIFDEGRIAPPVNFILDEFCNSPLHSLPSILTLLRSYGVKCTMATQDLDDIVRVYNKHALETIISESDVKQFLGGIRSKSTLDFLAKYLGEFTERSSNFSLGKEGIQESVSSINRSLLTADEVRRLDKEAQIIIKGNLKPILARKVPVFAVNPYRKEIAPNPMYGGKRFFIPLQVKLGWFGVRVTRRGRFTPHKSKVPIWRIISFAMKMLLPSAGALLALSFVLFILLQGFPHLRTSYSYSGSWSNPYAYHWCKYWGPKPFITRGGRCPFIVFRKVW